MLAMTMQVLGGLAMVGIELVENFFEREGDKTRLTCQVRMLTTHRERLA